MSRAIILICALCLINTSAIGLDPDFDLDGLLSAEEAVEALEMMFDELDQDDNNLLSVLEAVASLFEFGESPDTAAVWENMTLADDNQDGLVSGPEFLDYGMRRFDMHDSNDDGFLSPDEALQEIDSQLWPPISVSCKSVTSTQHIRDLRTARRPAE
jgi:hypothetical protein